MNVTPDLLRHCTDGTANTGNMPSPGDIASVCDVTGVDRAQAIILLKKWPAWTEAVTFYFDNPKNALQEDTTSRQWEPQDNVGPYADDMAMSRPPTPNHYIDLSDKHAEATVQSQNEQESEDKQVERALAESMKGRPGQESGTTSARTYFGPAERPHYDQSQWSLAPIASSHEVIEHPPATKRQRIHGEPAFLRSSPESGYNASLLTIYHSIPLAREALLFRPLDVFSYGHNPDWWSGTTDENTKALTFPDTRPGLDDERRYLAELQCVMAFLDSTSRAYGSVDALSELRHYQYRTADSNDSRFVEAWNAAAMDVSPDQPITQVFTSAAAKGPDVPGALPTTRELFQIEGPVAQAQNQYQLLDKIVWNDMQVLDDVWLEKLGHIITMKVYNDDPSPAGLGLLVSETWYLDRYTPEFREILYDMRSRGHKILREMDRLTKAQHLIAEMPTSKAGFNRVNTRKTLEVAKDTLLIAVGDATRQSTREGPPHVKQEVQALQTQLDGLLEEIDKKLIQLDQQKTMLWNKIEEIMSDITNPDHSSRPLRRKYVLQGVTTKPNVSYFRKLNHDLIGMEVDEEPHEIWQWWRTSWGEAQAGNDAAGNERSKETAAPHSVRKVSAAQVIEAVRSEHTTAILVYADETAMTYKSEPLSPALKRFVEQDNHAFRDEISLEHLQHAGAATTFSDGTNSTVMDDADPFDDGAYPSRARDMTPMSTSTIRSFDEPPSPRELQSSDESTPDEDAAGALPSYDAVVGDNEHHEMSENKGNKIGMFANQLLDKYGEEPRSRPE